MRIESHNIIETEIYYIRVEVSNIQTFKRSMNLNQNTQNIVA